MVFIEKYGSACAAAIQYSCCRRCNLLSLGLFRCRCVIGGIGEVWMLDDNYNDDDNDIGVDIVVGISVDIFGFGG